MVILSLLATSYIALLLSRRLSEGMCVRVCSTQSLLETSSDSPQQSDATGATRDVDTICFLPSALNSEWKATTKRRWTAVRDTLEGTTS